MVMEVMGGTSIEIGSGEDVDDYLLACPGAKRV
jgi:hypothetical protein